MCAGSVALVVTGLSNVARWYYTCFIFLVKTLTFLLP
jgi:hypothetical protein